MISFRLITDRALPQSPLKRVLYVLGLIAAVIVSGLSGTEGVVGFAAIIAIRGIDVFVTKRLFERSEAAWEMRQYFYEGEDQRGQ